MELLRATFQLHTVLRRKDKPVYFINQIIPNYLIYFYINFPIKISFQHSQNENTASCAFISPKAPFLFNSHVVMNKKVHFLFITMTKSNKNIG